MESYGKCAKVHSTKSKEVKKKILYLVSATSIEPGPPVTSEHMEQMIIPSIDTCIKLREEGKILAGGVTVAGKAGVFIVDSESNEALSKLLMSLPFWGIMDWDIVPMESLEVRNETHRAMVAQLKAAGL